MFEKILKNANCNKLENINTANDKKEEAIIENTQDSSWEVIKTCPNKEDVYSENLLNIIIKNNWEIVEYAKKIINNDNDDLDEYYSLKNNKYKFIVKHYADIDIEEGISIVNKITNLKTNEEIDFYVDLGCRNTREAIYNNFLMLLDCDSSEEYLNKKYKIYKELPQVLEQNNIKIEENHFEMSAYGVKGFLKLNKNTYIIPFNSFSDEPKVAIANKSHMAHYKGDFICYYVDGLNDIKDIDILLNYLNSFTRHINGEYGFLENGKYYKNNDAEEIFNFKKKDENGVYYEDFNHYHIRIEQIYPFNSTSEINVHKRLELAVHFQIFFNDAYQWSKGDIINFSDIIIKYDKNIDDKNCILMIKNYSYKPTDEFTLDVEPIEVIDDYDNSYNPKFLIDTIEIKDSFLNIKEFVNNYIYSLAKIFDVELHK